MNFLIMTKKQIIPKKQEDIIIMKMMKLQEYMEKKK